MKRREFLLLSASGLAALATTGVAFGDVQHHVKMYKSPECDCCEGHAAHLEQNGFKVTIIEDDDIFVRKAKLGIPDALAGCHTGLVAGYVIEGHIPASFVNKLIDERPAIVGLSIPGMPLGVPGMEGPRDEPLDIFVIDATGKTVYATI